MRHQTIEVLATVEENVDRERRCLHDEAKKIKVTLRGTEELQVRLRDDPTQEPFYLNAKDLSCHQHLFLRGEFWLWPLHTLSRG